MKTAKLVLKIVGAALVLAGAVCLVVSFWDSIYNAFASLGEKCSCHKKTDDFEEQDW